MHMRSEDIGSGSKNGFFYEYAQSSGYTSQGSGKLFVEILTI